jgi:hypothetical protein
MMRVEGFRIETSNPMKGFVMTIQLSTKHIFGVLLLLLSMLGIPQYANALSVVPNTAPPQAVAKVDSIVTNKNNIVTTPQPVLADFVTITRDVSKPNRGSGSIFNLISDCNQAFTKIEGRTIFAVPYTPAAGAVALRDREGRPSNLRPVFTPAQLQTMLQNGHSMVICGGEETSIYESHFGVNFTGSGTKAGDWIVGIPAEALYTDGSNYVDIRCINRKWAVVLPQTAAATPVTRSVQATPTAPALVQPVRAKPPAPKDQVVEYDAGTIRYVPVYRVEVAPARVTYSPVTETVITPPETEYVEEEVEVVESECPEVVWRWERQYLRRGEQGVTRSGWYDVAVAQQ